MMRSVRSTVERRFESYTGAAHPVRHVRLWPDHFFTLCSEVIRVQCALRTCSTVSWLHTDSLGNSVTRFQAFPANDLYALCGSSVISTRTKGSIGTSTHQFFGVFFHSKMAQNAPEFTSERLKSKTFWGSMSPDRINLWPDH